MKKKINLLFGVFLFLVLFLGVFVNVPRMLSEPSQVLAIELSKETGYFTNKKVEVLVWLGADPSAPSIISSREEQENEYNFILATAVRNNRLEVIPLLKADYSEKQKAIAYEIASEDQKLEEALNKLFND